MIHEVLKDESETDGPWNLGMAFIYVVLPDWTFPQKKKSFMTQYFLKLLGLLVIQS